MRTSKPFQPTQEQREAISHEGSALVLRASAGTGKTATLVARYLRYVEKDGLRPDQILTLTFTRKAAAEMKLRIVDALVAAGRRDEAQIAETGPIQTIHGYCERVLRECSVDAGLDPDFLVLDETEASRRLSEAIRHAIAESENQPLAAALIRRLAGRAQYRGLSPHGLIEETLRSVVTNLRGSTLEPDWLREHYRGPDQVLSMWKQMMLDAAPPAVRESMAEIEPGAPFGLRLKRAYRGVKTGVPKGLPSEANAVEAEAVDLRCGEESCGLVQMALLAWDSFEAANAEESALDFVELERRTVRLLRESEAAVRRMRRQYRAALVDESQDLNPIQHQLLDTLALDRQLFVGDAQQSIYSFRQADVGQFLERTQVTPTLALTRNFRSQESILHFVDTLFGQLWSEAYRPMANEAPPDPAAYPGVELWLQKSSDSGLVAEWIRDLIQEGEAPRDLAVLVRSGSYAQALLARLQALDVPARIAGGSERYYVRLEVRDMANVLSALSDPSDDFSLLAVLNSPIANLSLDAIVLLAKGKPVWPSLASFEAPSTEDADRLAAFRAWFEPLARYADRFSAWQLLAAVLARSPYFETVARRPRGIQVIANVRKLLSIAAAMPDADAAAFSARLREIRDLRHSEGDAPASEDEENQVTLMTVHKAKGLEFDVVVVPETLRRERPIGELEIDKKLGLITVKFEAGGSLFHQFNGERRKARDREEELRLLYVAMTRARRRLCVVVPPGGRNTTPGGRVLEALGWLDQVPEGVRTRHLDESPEGGFSGESS